MKKFNWIAVLILNIITCGIYSLYLWFVMAKNSNLMAEKSGSKKIMGFIPAVLLGCVTFGIFTIIWMYQFCRLQVEISKANGTNTQPTDTPILLLILMIVPVYSYYVLCDNYNRNVDVAAISA